MLVWRDCAGWWRLLQLLVRLLMCVCSKHLCDEHLLHSCDFRSLVDVRIRGELEHYFVLACAVGIEQLLHHRDRSLMMLDHVPEKQEVKVATVCSVEFLELGVGEHARH